MPLKGQHLSEEAKQKIKFANLGRHHTEESRLKMSESRKGKKCPWVKGGWHHTEETKEKIRQAHIGKPGTMLGKHLTPEQIEKARQFHLGRKRSDETRRKIREKRKLQKFDKDRWWNFCHSQLGKPLSEGVKAKLKEINKIHWDNAELRAKHIAGLKVSWQNEERRRNTGERSKRQWENNYEYMMQACQNPIVKEKRLRSTIKACNIKPNRQETILNNILSIYFPNDWKYVGNGDLIIAGKCPDFVNVNGKKSLIELWGTYWHRGENPEDRMKIFEPYGYRTLVVWEEELKEPDNVIQKVKDFFYV